MTAPDSPNRPVKATLKGWFLVTRAPFLSVGVFPYLLGAAIARHQGVALSTPVFWWGLAGVVLIMLATYFNGEYWDLEEDRLSGRMERNAFSGGSQAMVEGLLPPKHPLYAGAAAAGAAVAVGLVLTLVYRTGGWTVPLGAVGLLAGYFYSAPPFRWVARRGTGELLIGLCYGWLPVATGYYLQAGSLPLLLLWVSLPVAFTIFNVIFLNEYPDHPADTLAGKTNLLVRIGKAAGAPVYAAANLLAVASFALSPALGAPASALWWGLPFLLLAVALAAAMLGGLWRDRRALEKMCAGTIVLNLGFAAAYIAAFWPGEG